MQEIMSTPAIVVSAIAFGSGVVTALTQYLINYKPNKSLWNLGKKIEDIDLANKEDHGKIIDKLNTHYEIIKYYLSEKNVISRLSHIAKHAIEYTPNADIAVLVNKFVDRMIVFSTDITKIGIIELSPDQITSKILSLKCSTFKDMKDSNILFTAEISNDFSILFTQYKHNILEIYSDSVNDKTARFIVKTEDFIHCYVKKVVIYSNDIEGGK